MKHVKLFESFEEEIPQGDNGTAWTESIEIPEGYAIDFYRADSPEDCMAYYERSGVNGWSELSYEEWGKTLHEMGEQDYGDGRTFFRGRISWEPMGISINYEIHPL